MDNLTEKSPYKDLLAAWNEVNDYGEPLADSYIAYCVARKQEAERIIKLFKQYMERE